MCAISMYEAFCHLVYNIVQVNESWTRTLPTTVGRCITAMRRKFHPSCFVCSYCRKQLKVGTFKEDSDKPYCRECFYKIFG